MNKPIYSPSEITRMLDGEKNVKAEEWAAPEKFDFNRLCCLCSGSAFKTIAVHYKTFRVICPKCDGTGQEG